MHVKNFLEHDYTNIWGRDVKAFTTPDMKIVVELQTTDLDGGYWWAKLKTTIDRGNDEAFNFTREQCMSLASIFEEIESRNVK